MSNNEHCRPFVEELTGSAPLSPACAEHVKSCPDCRQMTDTIRSLKTESSAYSPAELEPFRHHIIKRLEASPAFAPKRARPEVSWYEALVQSLSPWQFSLGFATALVLIAVIMVSSPKQPATEEGLFTVTNETGLLASHPEKTPFELAQGKATLAGPDGSTLEITGPARLIPEERGFTLISGQVLAKVQTGERLYIGRTPHGTVEVLGTVFECISSAQSTSVRVISGRVNVVPASGSAKILESGQSMAMGFPEKSEGTNASEPHRTLTNLQGE